MSGEERFCPTHGYYDASLGGCPYCAKVEDPLAQPKQWDDEDALATQYPGTRSPSRHYEDPNSDKTIPPGSSGGDTLDKTIPPGQHFYESDKTQLYDKDVKTGILGWMIVKNSTSPRFQRGKIVNIKDGYIWGKDPQRADQVISGDTKISGIHARIKLEDEQFVIYDLGSSNGTWVNGEKISAPRVLAENDEILMGDTIFVLKTMN